MIRPVKTIRTKPNAVPAGYGCPYAGPAPRPAGPRIRVPKRPGVVRVGAVYPNLYVGGAEVWLRTLCRNLPEYVEPVGIAVADFGGLPTLDPHGLTVTRDLGDLARNCDVLIAWGIPSAAPIRKRFAGPVVYVCHSQPDQQSHENAALARECDRHVAVSEAARLALPEWARDSAPVIPNGVEPMPLPPRDHARRWLRVGDRIAVGYVGRWTDEKNPLACAMAVKALGPQAVAVYHGYRSHDDPGFRDHVTRLTGGRVIFRPPSAPVAETYAALDCFVHCPHSEAFALTYCEAWQAGVPVVATERGVVAECGIAREVAVIVPDGAPDAMLAGAVRRALTGRTVARAMRLVAERYSAAEMGRAWGRFLAEAVPAGAGFR